MDFQRGEMGKILIYPLKIVKIHPVYLKKLQNFKL